MARSESSLFRRNGADNRKLECLFLISAVHEERPQAEAAHHQQQVDGHFNEQEEAPCECAEDQAYDHPYNPKPNPIDVKENGLKRMKSHKAIAFERIEEKENDRSDESGEIRKGSRCV